MHKHFLRCMEIPDLITTGMEKFVKTYVNMLLPKAKNQFPIYIFFYWVVIWGFVFAYMFHLILPSVVNEGRDVKLVDCTKHNVSESGKKICTDYSLPYVIPLSTYLIYTATQTGIIIGIVSLVFGYSSMYIFKNNGKR